MPSRRAFLRTLGASAFVGIAGCSGGDRPDPEATTEPGTATEYQETTIMSPIPTTVASDETTATAGTNSTAESTFGTGTTADENGESTEETTGTVETTDDGANSRSSSNGGGNSSNEADSPDDVETTTLTTTEITSTAKPTTATTPTERPPTATTEPTIGTTTEHSTTATTTGTTETTTEQRTTTTGTTAERPPSRDGSWSTGPALPTPQSNASGGVVDGSLYCFGGIESGTNLPAVARTYRFDPNGGTWHRLEDMPRALWAPCGVAAEGRLYSFGGAPTNAPYGTGEPPSDEIFVYAPSEGWRNLTAETGARCPYPNWAMGGVYDPDDGLVYLVGGGTNVSDRESASDHGVGTDHPGTYDESRVWTFDPTTEEVVNPDLARLPEARRWPTVAMVEVDGETCLHSICGLFGVTGPTDDNLRYRVSTGEWESMTPAPRTGIYATNSDPVIDGTAYLTHGFFWEDDPSVDSYAAVCHAYDPAADSFRTDLPSPRRLRGGAVDAVVDGTLYVVGGHVKRYDRNGYHDCKSATEAFTPSQ